MAREIWTCSRCGTVHDFEEDEEPLAWFYCTLSVSPNDMSTQRCGGLVKPKQGGSMDEFGIKANIAEPRKQARTGALCWVILTNPGWGGERLKVLMRSRGGRQIETWVGTKRLMNLRAAWLPENLRGRCCGWSTREEAQAWATAWVNWVKP